jgi:DNA modification methylase
VKLMLGNCLTLLPTLPDATVDMIFCDLPYGTTYAKWDSIIPMPQLWSEFCRVAKPRAAIVLMASQPFTSALVSSNPSMFRCEWIWDKENAANFANAKRQPLKQHESVLVFGEGQTIYNPQMVAGKVNHIQGKNSKPNVSETRLISRRVADDLSGMKYPKSILRFPKHSSQCGLHPTQKPIELCEYLIRTYSNINDTVLDCCMGSGTTGVACSRASRDFIGIEIDATYYEIAKRRCAERLPDAPRTPNDERS